MPKPAIERAATVTTFQRAAQQPPQVATTFRDAATSRAESVRVTSEMLRRSPTGSLRDPLDIENRWDEYVHISSNIERESLWSRLTASRRSTS